jgi:hypothetical protein
MMLSEAYTSRLGFDPGENLNFGLAVRQFMKAHGIKAVKHQSLDRTDQKKCWEKINNTIDDFGYFCKT